MSGASFRRAGTNEVALEVPDLTVTHGQVVAVTGPVGSGKTALLLSMLGEMELAGGTSHVSGSVAYVGQKPWIMGTTIRDNILLGRDFDEQYYWKVISACNLASDIRKFSKGDLSELSDNGDNLSGGQRTRLALARAIYSRADIYILDDLLSAVDPSVNRSLWDHVLSSQGILRNSTRVLSTSSSEYALLCDQVVGVSGGR
ncbi:P-loop containing nucleoside triphosphate hydrolase protein, partial [Martensiomyces pterosporus]